MTVLYLILALFAFAVFVLSFTRFDLWSVWAARIACSVGAVLVAVSFVLAANLRADAETLEWAADAWSLCVRVGGIYTLCIGGATGVAALTGHKLVRVRKVVALCAVFLHLLVGRAYGTMCRSETVALLTPVVLFTAGCALVLLLPFCFRGKKSKKIRKHS